MKYFILLLISAPFILHAQNLDYGKYWILGCSNGVWDTTFDQGAYMMEFDSNSLKVSNLGPFTYCHDMVSAAITDSSGELLFMTTGVNIINRDFNPIKNGFALPADATPSTIRYLLPQGLFFLPMPEHPDSTFLFFCDVFVFIDPITDNYAGGSYNLTWSLIDHLGNAGRGEVVQRRIPLIEHDTMSAGQLTATRHANGRDWWVLSGRHEVDQYYRYLVTPNGINHYGIQNLGGNLRTSLGQACFSPNGLFYARYNTVNPPAESWFDLYDFDRCTGELNNHRHILIEEEVRPGGISFSPNSRFVYVSVWEKIYQFDLWAADIEASKVLVAEYDGYTTAINPLDSNINYVPTRFFLMQLANNGKIYISVYNYTSNVLHTIESPNEKGLACNVQQHSFYWPKRHDFGLPNMPNYGLGALSGSPCDTLGLSPTAAVEKPSVEVWVYPNPASDMILIEQTGFSLGTDMQIRVFDGQGKVCKTAIQAAQSQTTLNVADLPKGIYFYQMYDLERKYQATGTFTVLR